MRVCSAPRPSRQIRRFDLGNRIPAPGYLYVHVHGAAQAQVNGNTPGEVEEELATIASFHARHGTTGLLETTVVEDPKRLASCVAGVARSVRSSGPTGARILGCHLEGPFIAPSRAGHPASGSLTRIWPKSVGKKGGDVASSQYPDSEHSATFERCVARRSRC